MNVRHTISKKPVGQLTRGKTASNRLRRVDNFILLYEPSLLTRTDGLFQRSLFVDLGYGFDARTTLESAERFRRVNPNLPILGVEIDKERVDAALPYVDEITHFRLGGFNLPLQPRTLDKSETKGAGQSNESVRLIRAFNVLRQYEEKDFAPAYERLAEHVLPGGLMIEGTSNPFGSIWVANLVRKEENGWKFEALVFSTNFRMGFDITDFQAVLPKNYIHNVVQGEPIYDFIEAWKRSAAETSPAKVFGLKQWFAASAENLATKGYKIDLHKKWLNRGWLIWYK
ncbi:MAG: hypothetical protein H7Y59_02830 [Anaerolineales bacterium]|nr:hypothetical protein [Anaerolineales bacterium]